MNEKDVLALRCGVTEWKSEKRDKRKGKENAEQSNIDLGALHSHPISMQGEWKWEKEICMK